MHLQRIRAANFRAFGDGAQSPALDWELSPGLNILVGENDSGKTSVIDAIRNASCGIRRYSAVRKRIRCSIAR